MNDETPSGDSRTDEEILVAIQQRDDAALGVLYDRHGRLAFALAYRVVGERGAAEDIVQEAFLAVWRRATSFRPDRGTPRSWLMAIVHNAAIDRRRGRFKREQSDVQLDEVAFRLETDAEDTFATVAGTLDAEQVRAALLTLPVEQRQAIELAFFTGLTHQEISNKTGMPLGTVKSRMRLGLRKMRGLLEEQFGSQETDASIRQGQPSGGSP